MKRGDIVEFRRKGFVSKVLGGLLRLFERDWDGWGWHLAIAWDRGLDGWYIFEATALGQKINFYYIKEFFRNARSWTWLNEEPTMSKMNEFLISHKDKSYDVAIYLWTILQYIIRHYWNRRIPRLLNDRFTCWELAFEFCEEMGKPIGSKYDCPIITDAIKAFKEKGGE